MKKLILASASPRRIDILNEIGIEFLAVTSSFNELDHKEIQNPSEFVQKNAEGKARDVAGRFDNAVVIGADTVVTYGKNLIGKPSTYEEAFECLKMLNGKTHNVLTGISIVDTAENMVKTGYEKTPVTFRHLTDHEISLYLSRINPLDKAGAYAIQGAGAVLVRGIKGCYYNVVGLPVSRLEEMLSDIGVSLFEYIK